LPTELLHRQPAALLRSNPLAPTFRSVSDFLPHAGSLRHGPLCAIQTALETAVHKTLTLETQIAKLDGKIQEEMQTYQEAVDLCITIPGIEAIAAANLVAEIGVNMDQFPSAAHLASWAGAMRARVSVSVEKRGTEAYGYDATYAKRHGQPRTAKTLIYHQPYRDLGADYFDRRNGEQIKRSLIRRLERLGLKVTVQNPTIEPA
jgi:hypothetical protein